VCGTFPADPKFTIVGEAPGKEEVARGKPFVGPSGKLLRGLLTRVGLEPDDALFVNAVSCFPQKNGKPRQPDFNELAACRDNLFDQLTLGDPDVRHVLLVGATATSVWRSDVHVTSWHGNVGLWGEHLMVMPIGHPAAILRSPHKKAETEKALSDLRRFAALVGGEDVPPSSRCLVCGEPATEYDPDWVAWCRDHWVWGGDRQWAKERDRWVVQGHLTLT
jgi:DNA polymerase